MLVSIRAGRRESTFIENKYTTRGRRRRCRASHYKTPKTKPKALSAGTFRPVDYRQRWYRVKGVFALTAFSTGPSHVLKKEREGGGDEEGGGGECAARGKEYSLSAVHLIFK